MEGVDAVVIGGLYYLFRSLSRVANLGGNRDMIPRGSAKEVKPERRDPLWF